MRCGPVLPALALLACATAYGASISFDSLADGDSVTGQFAAQGVSFQNAIVLAAGISLNEFEFPPHSNPNVIGDNGGPVTIVFSSPQLSVSAFITYLQPVVIEGFDASNASLGSVSSAAGCASNLKLSGTPGCLPNEEIALTRTVSIKRVVISGNPAGGSFVLDDLSFSAVPEPATFLLAAGCVGALILYRLAVRRRRG